MNHHHRDLRPRARSAECHVGESATPPEEIERLVRRARVELGVIVFRREDLDRMDAIARRFIEGEHNRICRRGGR